MGSRSLTMIFFSHFRFKCQNNNDCIQIYAFSHHEPTENIHCTSPDKQKKCVQ